MSKHTRVLVVGLGSIGRRHARLIAERNDTELLLCDPVARFIDETEAALIRPATGVFSTFADALAAGPDLAFICTPNHLHVPLGLQAINTGVDLMVEKPISDALGSAEQLVRAADQAGRFLHIGYMLRFDPGLRKLKALVEDGAIGQPVAGRAMIGTYITLLNAKSKDRDAQPYSLVVDFSHELDFLRWFFGHVRHVAAMGTHLGNLELKPRPNVMQLLLAMANGVQVQVHLDYVQYPQRRTFEVIGDRGVLAYDIQTGEIRRYGFEREHRFELLGVGDIGQRVDGLYREQLASILARRATGEAPIVSGEDGLQALRVADAAIRSAEETRIITLDM